MEKYFTNLQIDTDVILAPWSDTDEPEPKGITITKTANNTNISTRSSPSKTTPPPTHTTDRDVDLIYRALFPTEDTLVEGVPTVQELDLLTANLTDMAKAIKNTNHWDRVSRPPQGMRWSPTLRFPPSFGIHVDDYIDRFEKWLCLNIRDDLARAQIKIRAEGQELLTRYKFTPQQLEKAARHSTAILSTDINHATQDDSHHNWGHTSPKGRSPRGRGRRPSPY